MSGVPAHPTPSATAHSGPLTGVRVVEAGGIGPAPFACRLLAELGADVVRFDRRDGPPAPHFALGRGKRSVALDLRDPEDVALALDLCERAQVLVEGFRPGVMEGLGLGPDALLRRNPALVYGRMTGWGQTGPLAGEAGHDINYLGLTGALWAMGEADRPPMPPLNLVADFGGGALYLVMGVLAALRHAERTGEGQVVDCAMTDGVISMTGLFQSLRATGLWADARGANLLDGGAPFYRCYACAGGGFVAVGALEPRFHAALLRGLGLAADPLFAGRQHDRAAWPEQAEAMAAAFLTRPRDAWVEHFAGKDACVSPVLDWAEAAAHPHNRARGACAGPAQGAPKLSLTPLVAASASPRPDQDRASVLRDWLGGEAAADDASDTGRSPSS